MLLEAAAWRYMTTLWRWQAARVRTASVCDISNSTAKEGMTAASHATDVTTQVQMQPTQGAQKWQGTLDQRLVSPLKGSCSATKITCSLKRLRRHQAAGPLPTPPARRSSQFVIMVTTEAFWLGEARQMTTEAQCEPTSASRPSVSRSAFALGYGSP
jgi:hypothetical protein